MLLGLTNVEQTIDMRYVCGILDKSEFDFYLTGPRLAHTANHKSDFDFFTPFSEKVKTFLKDSFFKTVPLNGHECDDFPTADKTISSVFRRRCLDGNVDVQVIHPKLFEAKWRANDIIRHLCLDASFAIFWKDLTKYSRRDFWNTVVAMHTLGI